MLGLKYMNPHMVRIAIVIDIINMRIIIELDKIGEFGESGFLIVYSYLQVPSPVESPYMNLLLN